MATMSVINNQPLTEDEIYDTAQGTHSFLLPIPASPPGGPVEYATDVSSNSATATDVDLFVGVDDSGNGSPDESEERCRSTSAASLERCSVRVARGCP